MKENEDFVRLLTLCQMFDCDRRTLTKVLNKLSESYAIETINWNGQIRVNAKQFRRAVLQQNIISC